MRILGLDLSLTSTGYVLLDEEDVVWFGVIGSDTLREAERLQMFDKWIREQVRDRRFEHVAIEGYSYGSKQTNLPQTGELGGIIKLAVFQARIPLVSIAPGTWKKVICGNGSLDKKDAAVEIYKRYGVEYPKRQDILDAWAVAMTLRRQLLGLDKPQPKIRRPRVSAGKVPPLIPAMEAALDEESAPATRRPAGAASP